MHNCTIAQAHGLGRVCWPLVVAHSSASMNPQPLWYESKKQNSNSLPSLFHLIEWEEFQSLFNKRQMELMPINIVLRCDWDWIKLTFDMISCLILYVMNHSRSGHCVNAFRACNDLHIVQCCICLFDKKIVSLFSTAHTQCNTNIHKLQKEKKTKYLHVPNVNANTMCWVLCGEKMWCVQAQTHYIGRLPILLLNFVCTFSFVVVIVLLIHSWLRIDFRTNWYRILLGKIIRQTQIMHSTRPMQLPMINRNAAHHAVHSKHCRWHMSLSKPNTTRAVAIKAAENTMPATHHHRHVMPTEMAIMIIIKVVVRHLGPLMPIVPTHCRDNSSRHHNNNSSSSNLVKHNQPTCLMPPTPMHITHKIVASATDAAVMMIMATAGAMRITTMMRPVPNRMAISPISILCRRNGNIPVKLWAFTLIIITKICHTTRERVGMSKRRCCRPNNL